MVSIGIATALLAAAKAELRLPKIFTDHMVLQQELPIAVWGWASEGETITVQLNGKSAQATAGANGKWRVDLPAMKADGRAHTLSVSSGNEKIDYSDVVLGEVWLCAGQSNMNREVEIGGDFPDVRLFWISGSTTPMEEDLGELTFGWSPATAEAIKPIRAEREAKVNRNWKQGFAEVGWVFGKRIHEHLEVPVGLIKTAFGGSQAHAWTPFDDIAERHPFGEKAEGSYIGHRKGLLYQSMLHGIVPLSMRGVIWYQGENDGRNKNYAEDLTTMIQSWRQLWGRKDLPFYMAQIAQTTYASGMLGVYEAQVSVMENLPHTAVASSNNLQDQSMRADEGDKKRNIAGTGWPIVAGSNPHPPNKHIVADRIADIALKLTYQEIEHEVLPPVLDSSEVKGEKMVIKLKNCGDGLELEEGEKVLNWFEISDGSKVDERGNSPIVYVKAEAKITGTDTIEVWSDEVKSPKFARFAWHPLARHNLINSEGIPAISFRTDQLPQMWNRR